MKVLEQLMKAIRNASTVNREGQLAPACILWPDRAREWESVIHRLQAELPELLVLGEYDSEKRTGPAIWLRCVIAGTIEGVKLPADRTPVLYLPGFSRQDLRASESCLEPLKPLAELQYRGKIWSQDNFQDWTVMAFAKSTQDGLGLDVPKKKEVREAFLHALNNFLDEDVSSLKEKVLDQDYFGTLVTGGDPVRSLLQWLDQGEGFQKGLSTDQWEGFVQICKSMFLFDPKKEGVLGGAARLAAHEGLWRSIWERFCEAPDRYKNIPAQIRKCHPPGGTTTWLMGDSAYDGWPQWNELQEKNLRQDLMKLGNRSPEEARSRILELEKKHGSRRSLVWVNLGESPLALALEHLAVLAEVTKKNLAFGTFDDLKKAYVDGGWRADGAVLKALAGGDAKDLDPVSLAIRSVYLPWAEESARHLQKLALNGYPGGSMFSTNPFPPKEGECVLFVDGLRFDTAKHLAGSLTQNGYDVAETPVWTPLPSVTATGKAAVAPVRDKIRGEENSRDFEPVVAETGQSLAGGGPLKKLLIQNGWKILEGEGYGDGRGNAWCEVGDIDHEGHDRGWKLARHLGALLEEIRDRIVSLLSAGWTSVRIVTDHGWLLLPGGLPKIELSSALVDSKWGRCASLKEGAMTEENLYPWFWNPSRYFALADGISCFRKGEEYTHGGLSLPECLTLELVVTTGKRGGPAGQIRLTDVGWKGFRCTVGVDGEFQGLSLDIRRYAGDPSTSVVVCPQPFKKSGTASVMVEDEDLESKVMVIVIVGKDGEPVFQAPTAIGGRDVHD